jgi:aminoglycoside phosphotransferase (APT) family kinase protein
VPATIPGPSLVEGYPERADLVARYAERSGRDLAALQDELDVYVAFARWRAACIGAGVHSRYVGGVMGGQAEADGGAARLASLQAQAEAALAALEG